MEREHPIARTPGSKLFLHQEPSREKEGREERYRTDGAGKITTPQGIDEKQARKLQEESNEVDGDTPLLQLVNKPAPRDVGSDFLVQLGGTRITAATIKAIQENMAETELGSEQGRGQKEGGQKELKQDIRSLVRRGQKRRKGRKRTCRQATGKTHWGPPSVKE